MLMTTAEVLAEQCEGVLLIGEPNISVSYFAIDSRVIQPGCVFVAFTGEKVDGHDFLDHAINEGARILVITKELDQLDSIVLDKIIEKSLAVIKVDDAKSATIALANAHRNRFRCPVVGITGSTGKTSTKDFVSKVLSACYSTVSTHENQNNELGVSLTLLSATAETEAFVIEMGMRGIGQIEELCQIALPTIGLITNVGTSHIELLGTEEKIAEAKGELFASLSTEGHAFINGDDDIHLDFLKKLSKAPVSTYGFMDTNDLYATDIQLDELSRPSFTLMGKEEELGQISLSTTGRYTIYNALAAIAIGLECEIPLSVIAEALQTVKLTKMRMEVIPSATGITVINDAYNANPTSMRTAITTLSEMGNAARKIAILGDMGELGKLTELAHFDIGTFFATSGVDELITVGAYAKRISEGAIKGGQSEDTVHVFEDKEETERFLKGFLATGDLVLVKASRFMGLEKLVEGIVSPSA